MSDNQDDIQKLSPQKLLQGFNKTPLLVFILVALGLHLLAFGVDYVSMQLTQTPTSDIDPNAMVANGATDANTPADGNAVDANQPATTDGTGTDPADKTDPRTPEYLTETQPAPDKPDLSLDETN